MARKPEARRDARWRRRGAWGLLALLVLLLGGPLGLLMGPGVDLEVHWRSADRSPAGLAPSPATHAEAVVQVYAARAFHWRGAFGVHTWIATKAPQADDYRVFQVTRWRRPGLVAQQASPDRAWFGSSPWLLADYRGEAAARLIPAIEAAVADYPAADRYRIWPGPNSNTFVAWVIRRVPGFEAHLPVTAVGKDYLLDGIAAAAPSGSGYQLSLGGLFGVLLALEEGIEFQLLGLTLGIDLRRPALKLPGIGRLGMAGAVAGASSSDAMDSVYKE